MIRLKDILLEADSKPVISITDYGEGFEVGAKMDFMGHMIKIGGVNIELRKPIQVQRNGKLEIDKQEYGQVGEAEVKRSQRRKGIYRDMILAAIKYAKKKGKKGIVSKINTGERRSDDADMFWGNLMRDQNKYGIKVTVDDNNNYYAS